MKKYFIGLVLSFFICLGAKAQEDFIVVPDTTILSLIRTSIKKPLAFVIPADGENFSIWRYVPTSTANLDANVIVTYNGVGRWLRIEYYGNIVSMSADIDEIFSDKIVLSYDGKTHFDNYAAPIGLVRDLTPLVANDIDDLLAVQKAGGSTGFSQYAHVETGTYKGKWLFCPLLLEDDNAKDIRRPNNIANNSSEGRWIRVDKNLTGSKTYDPANMSASGGTTSTTVTVTGAILGAPARAGLSTLTTQAITISAHVSATDIVTVVLFNPTGSSVDLSSGTLTAIVELP